MSDMRWLPLISALLVAFGYFGYIMQTKFRLLLVAQHRERFFEQLAVRAKNVFVYAFGQKKMFKEKGAGLMHAFIFWGFLVLQIRTIFLFACAFDPSVKLPLHGPYTFLKDITELIVLVALGVAAYRRLVTKPARLSFSGEALLILGLIGTLILSDFLLDGTAFALAMKTEA
ncbi:MAG: hypothetical protein KDA62_17755, partial [Planctomycetales bacterium]|nr:hypothetical protein [Planctomycetales bacterium]